MLDIKAEVFCALLEIGFQYYMENGDYLKEEDFDKAYKWFKEYYFVPVEEDDADDEE